jgi:ADP-ribose pyrophosphatase YjhB (NUDIX family)
MSEPTNNARRYNCALATVDIAIMDYDRRRILLGRKPNQGLFRFFGGFVDPLKDKSILDAAKREAVEEAGDLELEDFIMIGNPVIPDSRYANDKDKIFTTFYVCQYIFGNAKACDDIEEVKWFNLVDITKEDIMPVHHELFGIWKDWIAGAKV